MSKEMRHGEAPDPLDLEKALLPSSAQAELNARIGEILPLMEHLHKKIHTIFKKTESLPRQKKLLDRMSEDSFDLGTVSADAMWVGYLKNNGLLSHEEIVVAWDDISKRRRKEVFDDDK